MLALACIGVSNMLGYYQPKNERILYVLIITLALTLVIIYTAKYGLLYIFTDYKEYNFKAEKNQQVIVKVDQIISPADKIATGKFTNNTLYKFLGRMLLLALFIFISIVVLLAYKKRVKEGRATL